jgi:pimeloyl-ACP methyl ester carboxylesterase
LKGQREGPTAEPRHRSPGPERDKRFESDWPGLFTGQRQIEELLPHRRRVLGAQVESDDRGNVPEDLVLESLRKLRGVLVCEREAEAIAKAGQLNLDGVAQKIKQPLLIIQGKLDRLIPWEQAHKIVNAVGPNAELALFEGGNHVCNNIPYVYRPLTADWLKEKLG